MARFEQIAMRGRSFWVAGAVLACVCWLGGTARADMIGSLLSLKITAVDGLDILDEVTLNFPIDAKGKDKVTWALEGARDLTGKSGMGLGKLKDLWVEYEGDPIVSLRFAVENTSEFTTEYTITSAKLIVTPAPLVNPEGYASASITLTDDGGAGATLAGSYGDDGYAYEARYNIPGANFADGTLFAQLIGGTITAAPESWAVVGERNPVVAPNMVDIWDTNFATMQTSYKFTLSAGDSASGTSTFKVVAQEQSVVPLPSTAWMGLVMLGAMIVTRQVRRSRA